MEKPEEINELKRLRQRVRQLEGALADANIDLALERAYTELACERAGVDPQELKKKRLGSCAQGARRAPEARLRGYGGLGVPEAGHEPSELLCASPAPGAA